MMLKLKLQYFGHLMWRTDSLEKGLWCWEGLGAGGEGMTDDKMGGWHHWLDKLESEWTPGDGDGQGGLECCDSWGRKESDSTERLNWTELNLLIVSIVMPFSECHIAGAVQEADFPSWRPSLRIRTQAASMSSWLEISFLFGAEYYPIVKMQTVVAWRIRMQQDILTAP